MPVSLLFLEFIGTTELMVIAFVALVIFGPRKLPELGRSLGRSLGEFKRASEDFKRTWEYEVEVEKSDRERRIEEEARDARLRLAGEDEAGAGLGAEEFHGAGEQAPDAAGEPLPYAPPPEQTIARAPAAGGATDVPPPPARKQDWL